MSSSRAWIRCRARGMSPDREAPKRRPNGSPGEAPGRARPGASFRRYGPSLPAGHTQIAPVRSPAAAIPTLTLVTGSGDEDEPVGPLDALDALDRDDDEGDDRPLDVILDAIGDETDVRITYAGADGVTDRRITPIDVEGGAGPRVVPPERRRASLLDSSILAAIPAHER